ncbi:uncharacterized protein LOC127122482 [Lathyrus oleraceus]|uniref:uncharacterized protein LOC127122482 n=1 Tax=Pisum sativum TaxID=3888 RepID=UPI0021CEB6A2|nr:uncharacterized protein LOC127122482 [Pisum sativum]
MTDIPTGGVRTLHMEVGIFGFDYDQMIGNEDFMQVFSHEEIGVNVVNTYIRFLYDKLMRPNGLDVSFGFLAPATVNLVLILNRPDTVTEYVLRILMDNKDAEKLFFIPFNTGGHWLLLAINPIREIVYYLDSLGNDWTTYPDMKVLIDTVLQAFRAQRVIQTSRRECSAICRIKFRQDLREKSRFELLMSNLFVLDSSNTVGFRQFRLHIVNLRWKTKTTV